MSETLETSSQMIELAHLQSVDLFQRLHREELRHLASQFEELVVPAEQLLARQGEPAAAFFVVMRGGVVVFRDARGEPMQLLARLHAGEFFGVLGLLGSGRYSASVRALEPSRVLRISTKDFLAFLADHPTIFEKLQARAAQRHSAKVASSLELGRRREVRIRCDREVDLGLHDGTSRRMVVENLSLGGICLSQVPESWDEGREVSFSLAVREHGLPLVGRVVWRRGERIGIVFTKHASNHDMMMQMAIRLLVESPC